MCDQKLAEISAERLEFIEALIKGGAATERWERHTGVSTVADLRAWAENQLREVLLMRARRAGDGEPPDDKLEDYLIGKQAVLMPLLANFRQIDERRLHSKSRPDK